jgi:anaerobic magnesium-protoporphyrin IX monomethyl ester cyclase
MFKENDGDSEEQSVSSKGTAMKFLLVYPPAEPFFITHTRTFYGLSPPLGLLYIATMLENEGDQVTVLDFSAEPYDEQKFLSAVRSSDIIGFTMLSSSFNQAKHLIECAKQQDSDIPLVIGGPHCTLQPEKTLEETQATLCVQGEGEMVINDIKKALNKEIDFSELPGVVYRTTSGIKHGQPQQLVRDLNNVPFPARHLVKQYVYGREYNPRLKAGEFTSIITSRGCPHTCRFCSRGSLTMQRYRVRSKENIISELKEIQQQGYRHVIFSDDCFPTNTKQATALFDAIISEELDLKFSVTATRVDLADEGVYKKMRQAGVTHMQFGLESGNQDVLDYYHKHTTIDMIRKAVFLSHETGFFTIGSFILGAPFETTAHFNRTLAFAKSLPLESVSFLPLRYMIGSELWNEAVHEGKISESEYLVSSDKNRGLGNFTKEELLRFCMNAQRSFYARPAFFFNLLKKSLHNNDMTYVQSYLSLFSSSIKGIFG